MYFLLSVWSVFKERIYVDFFRNLDTFVECFETTAINHKIEQRSVEFYRNNFSTIDSYNNVTTTLFDVFKSFFALFK